MATRFTGEGATDVSQTIVDMAKVTQALDAGWTFRLYKGGLGTYTVVAVGNKKQMAKLQQLQDESGDLPVWVDEDGECVTDDWTPQQALTRMAYKVHGEII